MTLEEQMEFIKQQYTDAYRAASKPGASLEEQIAQRKLAQKFADVSASLKRLNNIRILANATEE